MLKIIRCQTTVGLTPTAGLNFKGMTVPTFLIQVHLVQLFQQNFVEALAKHHLSD